MHRSIFLRLAPSLPLRSAKLEAKVQNWCRGGGEKERRNARGNFSQCIFLISSSDLKSPPACLFHFHVKPCHLPRGGYAGMPHQYKICTLLRSLAAAGGAGLEGAEQGREGGGGSMGTRWNCALFVALCTYRGKTEQQ